MADVDTLAPVLYARHSRGGIASIDRQSEDGRQVAAQRGLPAPIELTDTVTASGAKTRHGFAELMRLITSGSCKVVIAWTWERLERNREDGLALIEAGKAHGVTVILVRGTDMDLATPSGRFVADILGGVARQELDMLKDRQRRAQVQALAEGRRSGGRRPFGYTLPGMVPLAVEAEAVAEGYRWLLAGETVTEIARRWNAAGLTTPQGARKAGNDGPRSPWGGQAVSRALAKPAYAGLRAHRGAVTGDAVWPALVDRATWEAAQAILSNPARRTGGGPRCLLTGIAVCGICGAPVHAGGANTAQGAYRCSASPHLYRTRAPIDTFVRGEYARHLDAAEHMAAHNFVLGPQGFPIVVPAAPPGPPVDPVLIREIEALESQLDRLAGDLELSPRVLAKRTGAIEARLTDLRQEIAVAAAAGARHRPLDHILQRGEHASLGAAFLAADVETQRAVLEADIGRLVITLRSPGRGARTFRPESVTIEPVE